MRSTSTLRTVVLAALLLAGPAATAATKTFDLRVYGYCDPASNLCGHGSQAAWRAHVLAAIQETNLQWETVGISFRPFVEDIDQSNSVYEDIFTCGPPGSAQYSLLSQWRQSVAQMHPGEISVILTANPDMCCSEVRTNTAPPSDYYGIFCNASPQDPYFLGSVLAHELGHHFCLAHTFGWNKSTLSFMDSADYSAADDGALDWDGDNERGPDYTILDTPRDAGEMETSDSAAGHQWCAPQIVHTPGAVDALSPHDRYCNLGCFNRTVAGQPPVPFSLQDSSYPPIASRVAMSYHPEECRGPYVIDGVRYESFTQESENDIQLCYTTYRDHELPDVCQSLGGDTDSDGICNQTDNCATIKNTPQGDLDNDGTGDACDFELGNPGSVFDTDGDGLGPFSDPDSDGDGCLDGVDQHPSQSYATVGSIYNIQCPVGSKPIFRFEGVDSDGDFQLDCRDLDDDNDGICDEGGPLPVGTPGAPHGCDPDPAGADPCPVTLGNSCHQFGALGPCPPPWVLCQSAGCAEFFLKLKFLSDPDPFAGIVFEHFQIVNDTLYLPPSPIRTISELALALTTGSLGGSLSAGDKPQTTLLGGGVLRLSVWSRITNEEVAVVADYDPADVVLGDVTRGLFLAITPGGGAPGAPALALGATFARGLAPGEGPLVDADDDGWPDPLDNCTQAYNPLQTDADGDGFGNLCDADLDGDRLVTSADLPAVQGCSGADLSIHPRLSEPDTIQGMLRLPPNPIVSARAWSCRAADLDDNHMVNQADADMARLAIGSLPGPSGRATTTNLCVPGGCDDGDPCTRELCAPATGECFHLSDTCDDGDACTEDICIPGTGACVHDPVVCEDGNSCTADRCEPGTGLCVRTILPDGSSCDDGTRCTANDRCTMGQCSGPPGMTCDDGNPCTPDSCDPMLDQCVSGPAGCDDGNPCTTDACGRSGCVHTPVADLTPCSDADACTLGDACRAGQCTTTGSVSCDDGDFCTIEQCEPATGECLRDPRSCEDFDDLTQDSCDSIVGTCVNAPIVPPAPDTLIFVTPAKIQWQPTSYAMHWNTYRGTIPAGLMGSPGRRGPYDHICFESADLGADGPTTTVDFSQPPAGTAFYYVVSSENFLLEGWAVEDSSGRQFVPPSPCMTPP